MTLPAHAPTLALSRDIIRRCTDRGFALAGIAPASPSDHAHHFRAWLARGHHGTMRWLEDFADVRLDPRLLTPGGRSVIIVADQYASRNDPHAQTPLSHGRIARYAAGRDYHAVIKKRLRDLADDLRPHYPGHRFRSFADSAPVLEREHAARCGLGWVAKHTLLIHPRLGSWFLLGGIVTTLDLPVPPEQEPAADACGSCTRCIDACPTQAISPYSIDASRCISYLTIERKGLIDESFHPAIGQWIYGCDVCQDVCPHNSPRAEHVPVGATHAAYAPTRPALDLLDILAWDEHARRAAFHQSPMKRANLDMIRRNALIAAGNVLTDSAAAADLRDRLRQRAEALAADPDQPLLVRQTAAQVLRRASRTPAPA